MNVVGRIGRGIPDLGSFDPRLRRGRAVGLTGSVILAIGAVGGGVLPASDPFGQWPVVQQLRAMPSVSLVLAGLGLTLLVLAWLGIGPVVAERAATGPQLIRVLSEWSLPLALVPPLYSRDVYSYVVQGAMYRDGLDPYRVVAAHYHSELAVNVSSFWQHSTAPYGPVFLAVAAGVMLIAGNHVVVAVLGMRLVMVAAFALIVHLVPVIARRSGVDEAAALWLAVLNPLAVVHLVSGAHNDALLIAILLAAMVLAARGRPICAVVLIGAAVLVKASALVALVFVIPAAARMLRGRWTLVRGGLLVALAAAVTMSVITALAGAWYGWVAALGDTARVHNGLSISTDAGMFGSWLGALAHWHGPLDPVSCARLGGLVVAVVVLLLIFGRTRGRPVYGLGLALSAIVLLGPVVHPWYLLWGFVPLAATERNPRVIRAVALVSAVLVFYPMPSGGPETGLAFEVVGVLLGALGYAAVVRAPSWHGLLPRNTTIRPTTVSASGAGSVYRAGCAYGAAPPSSPRRDLLGRSSRRGGSACRPKT